MLTPLLATHSTLLGVVDVHIGRCLLATAWGRLPTSLDGKKFSRLAASGVWGSDAMQLLGGVPKNIVVSALALPGDPIGEPWVQRAGPVATMGPRMRSQLVAMVPSLSWRALRWASTNWFWCEPS
jgi:hypothetical protein